MFVSKLEKLKGGGAGYHQNASVLVVLVRNSYNYLTPGKYSYNLRLVIFKHISRMEISFEIALKWMPLIRD